jgi:type IV secretory pathway VirJ component
MVVGIDTPRLFAALESDGSSCVFPDGDLENLSHYVQGYARLPTYHTPLMVGYSSGASMAYAMLAQAPSGTFIGALSLGFCADLDLAKPLCRGEGVHFTRRKDGKGVDLLPSKALP